jgi:hypothetical protein
VLIGLLLAATLLALGLGTGYRQASTLRRVREQQFMAVEDRVYFRGQAYRRLVIAALLLVVSGMMFAYYLSGMDARMDAIPERNPNGEPSDDPQARSDKQFTRFVGIYWIAIVLVLGLVVLAAVFDFWATRKYWMARYKELKAEHEAKLQRDLAVYRQQKLNDRARGLRQPPEAEREE